MKLHRIAIPLLGIALVLSGCSSPASAPAKSSVTETAEAESVPVETSATSIASVVALMGMTDYAQSATAAPFATQWGEGTYEGSKVQVYEFASDDDYASFLDSIASFGITEAQLVKTGLIVVAVTYQTKTEAVRSLLG